MNCAQDPPSLSNPQWRSRWSTDHSWYCRSRVCAGSSLSRCRKNTCFKSDKVSSGRLGKGVYLEIGGEGSVCKVGTVAKISDYQPEGPGFNPRFGQGFNFG